MVWLFPDARILIRGGGDLGSGVAYRLLKAGFPVTIIERPRPLFVRRSVSFGNAIFEDGAFTVEGHKAVLAASPDAAESILSNGHIPVLIDEAGASLRDLKPSVLIDARMQKRNIDTTIHDAPLVIGMGPGFTAGEDCHAVIETSRGHWLGRVIWSGTALPDTGTPWHGGGLQRGTCFACAHRWLRDPR